MQKGSEQSQIKSSTIQNDTIFCWQNDNKYKLVLVGDSGVGKTSIFWQYIEEFFPDDVSELKVTMVDFKIKNIVIENELIKLYIWDTAGQERYRSLVSNYFKGTHGLLMIFDLGNANSFESLRTSWIDICKDKAPDAIYMLIGNKSDLPTRSVSSKDIDTFSKESNISYFEVSAFNGTNISEAFDKIACEIKEKFFPKEKLKEPQINILDSDIIKSKVSKENSSSFGLKSVSNTSAINSQLKNKQCEC